jgi:hypothetical protein
LLTALASQSVQYMLVRPQRELHEN